jgi:hypothetical protein
MGAPVSSSNKTDLHNIAEILLKVVLNTTTLTQLPYNHHSPSMLNGWELLEAVSCPRKTSDLELKLSLINTDGTRNNNKGVRVYNQ